MQQISNHYVKVEKADDTVQEGFQTVQVQDNFIYKGKIVAIPETPVFLGNRQLAVGDVIHFPRYSPDTHEIEKFKFVKTVDILEVI